MNPYIILITLIATLGGLLFGYDTAVISGAVNSLQVYFVDPKHLGPDAANSLLGFVVSSALIGCILGGLIGGWVSVYIGRKRGLIIAAVLFLVSALGSSAPEFLFAPIGTGGPSYIWFFVFYRIIGGVGVGLASMLSPMYIAEIAPARIRGNLVAWNQMAIVTGIVVVYFVNYAIAQSGGTDAWLNAIGWRYPDEAEKEVEDIEVSLAQHHSGRLFSFGFAVVAIGIMLSVFQQWVGVNVVLYYAPEIFKSMGLSTHASLLQTILVGSVNFIFTVVAILTVDRLGRVPLQIIGALVMALSMIGLGTGLMMHSTGPATLICMMVYMAGFAFSWGPVTWVLLSEIFPNVIRGKAMALAVAAQWIANYFVSSTFPILKDSPFLKAHFNGGFPYFIYGLCAILAALFMWKFVPETKGRTLEQMESLWGKQDAPRA
jgi:SP family xylose:H+ symportor-like MFS transporter